MTGGATAIRTARDVVALAIVGVWIVPLVWWILTSFRTDAATMSGSLLPIGWTLENYALVAGGAVAVFDGRQAILDSLVIACVSTLLSVTVALAAAIGLQELKPGLARAFVGATLLMRLVPPIALAVPAVLILNDFGLYNTRIGLIVMHALLSLPVALLLLRSFLEDVPREVEDAARLDGATRFQLVTRITMPLIRGGVATTAAICFVLSWTEFLLALFVSVSFRTLPVMMSIVSELSWGAVAALGTLGLVPALAVLALARRGLVRGLTLGLQR